MIGIRASLLGVAIAGVAAARAFGATADTSAVTYALSAPPSVLEWGCQGSCECAVYSTEPTYGSFQLAMVGVMAGFTVYDVRNYIASFNNGPGAVSLVGSGQYRVRGGASPQQQLILDLEVWGQPEHFDSGLVPVQAAFPQIDVSCAVHGFACLDSVLVVDAKPADLVNVTASARVTGIRAIRPSPFRGVATVDLALARDASVDVTVLDASGRRVRVLAAHEAMSAGRPSLTWDGRRDDGAAARAGVYWVLMRWDGGADRRRIVKLD
jgi:hypothetical protein